MGNSTLADNPKKQNKDNDSMVRDSDYSDYYSDLNLVKRQLRLQAKIIDYEATTGEPLNFF